MSAGRGTGGGSESQWDDSVWQRDQGYDPQGYDPQGYDPEVYNGPGYGGQDYDRPGYAPQPQAGQPNQGGPQRYPRTGPQPTQRSTGAQPVQRGSGPYPAQPGQRGQATGPRPVQRGSGGMPQVPGGYDQRGTGGHRMTGAGGYEDPRWEEQRAEEFLPGFAPRDDFEGSRGRGQDRQDRRGQDRQDRARDADRRRGAGRGRDQTPDRGGYDGYEDPRAQRGPAADPRSRDAREPVGYPDARRQQGRRPEGPDPRTRDPRDPRDPRLAPRDDLPPRRRRRSPLRRLAPWLAFLVIIVPLALGGWHVYGIWKAKTHPADYVGSGTGPAVTVQVLPDETAGGLAPTLYADGVVASTRAFVLAAENSTDPTGLEPGYFTLNRHMQASLAWAALLNPKNRDQSVVTIPEGKRASQVIATLAQVTKIPLKDFQQVISHPAQLGLPSYADGKVEGFLFPATYTIEPHETALQILQAMVARYNVAAQQINLPAAAKKIGLTSREVIIEASMAQAEGGSVSDYPKIAEVINNRLKIGMALQFDSVLLYGLNKYAINVTDAQIATPGPYNDFKHDGLPPGPISNPGNAAIEGILNPASGNWLYFLTVSGGKSEFSATPLAGQ